MSQNRDMGHPDFGEDRDFLGETAGVLRPWDFLPLVPLIARDKGAMNGAQRWGARSRSSAFGEG